MCTSESSIKQGDAAQSDGVADVGVWMESGFGILRSMMLSRLLPRTLASPLRVLVAAGLCCTGFVPSTGAQAVAYEAREVMIPMRDGVKLYTQVFEPVGTDEPGPILFRRTPYEIDPLPARVDPARLGPSPAFADSGYIFVRQDARGTFGSEGEWELLRPMRADRADTKAVDESTDAYDTIEWLLENVEQNNGRVGMWGISYDGWQTVMAMADAHPALVAVSPQASPGDWFLGDDAHHHGAFRLNYMFFWIGIVAMRRGDVDSALIGPAFRSEAYSFFRKAGSLSQLEETYFQGQVGEWTDLLEHGDYDAYWEKRNVLKELGKVGPAVLNVAGWFDAEDFRGPVDIYSTIEATSSADRNHLVIGPWQHGGWNLRVGDGSSFAGLDFEAATGTRFQEEVEFPFFERYLWGSGDPAPPQALVFETGANVWHELDEWPPQSVKARDLYLRSDATASFQAPDAQEGHTAFVSNPLDPVPHTASSPVLLDASYMAEDQRYLAAREDVLSFLTTPLEEDLVIAGRPQVHLQFSTTGTDADWVVKLIDVYPADTEDVSAATGKSLANAQILIVGDIFRAKYRASFEQPSALEPGQLTPLNFELPDRFHRFRKGHRILVQVHSTWFPLYDRNPQKFMDIYGANEKDLETHEHRIFHEQGAASLVRLPVWGE